MKLLILVALVAVTLVQGQIHIPDKCEDVLAVKVCDRLIRTATALKLKSEEVKVAVLAAYKQGKTQAKEIEKAVNDFLVNKVLNKQCTDITTEENCKKITAMVEKLNVAKDKVQEFVVREIANLKTKTCEDFLDIAECTKLRDLAGKLKIKAEKVQDMLIESYIQAKANGTKIAVETYNKVKEYVMTTKCEDMFNPGLCTSFRKYAEKTKVALPKIMETAFDLIVKGVAISKSLANKVYDIIDYFYDCKDVFDDNSCDRLTRWAAKLKVTAIEVEIAVRKYVRIFIEKGTTIYKTIRDFVKEKIICKFSSDCTNAEDSDEIEGLAINKRSLFGDWKNKVIEIINTKFPNLEANLRQHLEELVVKSKSFFEFMKANAKAIQAKVSDKYTEILKKLMVEATL